MAIGRTDNSTICHRVTTLIAQCLLKADEVSGKPMLIEFAYVES